MTKRLTTLSLLVVIGAAVAVALAGTAGAASSSSDLHTTAKLTFAHPVDLGRHGPSAGDLTTFGGKLIGPDLKGSYQASCVNVTPARQECSETLITPTGKIAAQASYGHGSTAVTPIVGGSGAYSGVRGDMTEQEIANGREVTLVLHLQN